MVKFAICDDHMIQRTILTDAITDYIQNANIEGIITAFANGEELVQALNDGNSFDIYILDIILPGLKGTDVGKFIRETGQNGRIIFLTATNAFEKKSKEIDNCDYILKPVNIGEFTMALNNALN